MPSNNNIGNAHNRMLDHVSIPIRDKLARLPPTPQKSIFKVYGQLRKVNEKAYEPQYLAIGPYHYNNDRLHYMEEQKLHYLQQMIKRIGESCVDRCLQALREIEVGVRQQYAGVITLTQNEFLEMMLIDGCFIIEYFRKFKFEALRVENEDDPLLSSEWIRLIIGRDLVLLENQLPFIVLQTLYDMTKDDARSRGQYKLADIALNFLGGHGGLPQKLSSEGITGWEHLLDLVYQAFIVEMSGRAQVGDFYELPSIHTATELKEFGIKFKSVEGPCMFNIEFNKDTLELPRIHIGDGLEPLLRNLIAYEQYCPGKKIKYVSDYVDFLDMLVNTPKDVELLRQKGIIVNYLGDDQAVSEMLNKMGDHIPQSNNSYFLSMFAEVSNHCKKRRNRWMALLQRDYFHSPWALISVIAAFTLLLLTLIQTIFSGLSYRKD